MGENILSSEFALELVLVFPALWWPSDLNEGENRTGGGDNRRSTDFDLSRRGIVRATSLFPLAAIFSLSAIFIKVPKSSFSREQGFTVCWNFWGSFKFKSLRVFGESTPRLTAGSLVFLFLTTGQEELRESLPTSEALKLWLELRVLLSISQSPDVSKLLENPDSSLSPLSSRLRVRGRLSGKRLIPGMFIWDRGT